MVDASIDTDDVIIDNYAVYASLLVALYQRTVVKHRLILLVVPIITGGKFPEVVY